MEVEKYARVDGFQIVANHKDLKVIDFSICDINGFKIIDKKFKVASEAILFLEEVLRDESGLSAKKTE